MKNRSFADPRLFLILLLAIVLPFALVVTGCGGVDAKTKKEQAKAKRKAAEEKKEADAEKTDEKAADNANTDAHEVTEEKSADKDEKEKDAGHKKDEKKSTKTESKASKTETDAIWADLVKGNKRFMAGKHTPANYLAARHALAKGQQPKVIVLGCADSRVPPELVFDKNLGELFVVRDAGNISDEVSLGSIEYAVEHLHAKLIVVLGHESCGAVAAAVSGEEMPTRNLRAIVESIVPAFEGSSTCIMGKESNLSCVELNVKQSSGDLVKKSPIIKKAVSEGEIAVIRAVYRMETGEVVRVD